MRGRRYGIERIIRLVVLISILGSVITAWLASLADAGDAPAVVHDMIVEGGAGLTALGGAALYDMLVTSWRL